MPVTASDFDTIYEMLLDRTAYLRAQRAHALVRLDPVLDPAPAAAFRLSIANGGGYYNPAGLTTTFDILLNTNMRFPHAGKYLLDCQLRVATADAANPSTVEVSVQKSVAGVWSTLQTLIGVRHSTTVTETVDAAGLVPVTITDPTDERIRFLNDSSGILSPELVTYSWIYVERLDA